MIVVADTSPINYLILIGEIQILQRLYKRILIPPAVLEELRHRAAPKPVQDWIRDPPGWIGVQRPKSVLVYPQLDLGESEAIALATEVRATVLLIDDFAGRQEAARLGTRVAGTLSVLDEADQVGLVDFERALVRLLKTSFRVSQAVLAEIRERRLR